MTTLLAIATAAVVITTIAIVLRYEAAHSGHDYNAHPWY